jgi:peptide/nickel transport system substrate-binding protein
LNKKIPLSILFVTLLLAAIPFAFAHNAGFPPTYNQNALNIDTIGEPETVDPAWAYDTSSGAVIQQVYETLIFYKNDWTLGPYASGLTDQFVPMLATSVPTAYRTTGLPAGKVAALDFTIAAGHKFSDGNTVTAQDVEYSYERMLVQDRDGGPQWMVYFPLLGTYAADTADSTFGTKIDGAITSSGNTVTFNFDLNFPLKTWLQIIAQTWGSVVEKSWAVGLGDFDGNWAASWTGVIVPTWHNPGVSFVEDHMMGSAAYKLNFWTHGVAYSVNKNPNYWQGFPATVTSGDTSGERVGGSLDTITWNYLASWTTRRPRLLAGDSDLADVDRQFRDQVLGQPGIRAFFPFGVLTVTAYFFTFDITTTSPYASWNAPGVFTETGLPPNVFNDIHARKGFAYAFDYNSWLTAAFLGEGEQPASPVIDGLSYQNPNEEKYSFDLTKAKAELQAAFGGALWANGFTFTVTYNTGNVGRQTAAEMIANNVNSLNSKFHISTLGIPWGSTYLPQMVAGELPVFIIGWAADYPDPDNFVFPFMHSQGTFSAWQKYSNARVDALVTFGATVNDDTAAYAGQLDVANPIPLFNNAGNLPPDTRWPRRSTYYELQRLYFDDVPGATLVQASGRHWERDWVRGWYYNPIYPGNDYYHLWKAATHNGDSNNNGAVDVGDAAWISSHWTAASLAYNPSADINGGKGGLTGNEYQRGMADGIVDITDIGLISAYFDGPPQGPAHP